MNISVDGVSIFVGQGGMPWKADQRTLVLQHGAGMDRTVWVLLARYFARHGFNVVAADLPGHGASKGEALESIQAQAEYLWRLLDVLQASHELPDAQVILGGHSMGSLMVLDAASQQADRVEQLILFGAGYPMPVGAPLLDAAQANSQTAVDMIAIFSHSYGSQLGHNHMAGISVQNMAMALLERAAPGVLYTDLKACNDYQGGEAAAQAVKGKPCTLIVGRNDRMTPVRAAGKLAGILQAQLTMIDKCGHMMMSEQPEATLQAARQCLLPGSGNLMQSSQNRAD
ncbi:MAG: alpha/beta fold hydrolase [Granulosicoccus sp.]